MKKLIIIFLFSFLFIENNLESTDTSSAITYIKPMGRFGDNLFCYCKAKWVAYKYNNIPLYYKSFKYSNKLFLSMVDKVYEKSKILLSKYKIKRFEGYNPNFSNNEYIYINSDFDDDNTLYVIDQYFFPEMWKHFMIDITANVIHPYNILYDKDFVEMGKNKHQTSHDEMIMAFRQDPKFIEELRKVIKPINELVTISRPEEAISVAVHVRIGSLRDPPHKSPYFYNFKPPKTENYIDFVREQKMISYYAIQQQVREKLCSKVSLYGIFQHKYDDVIRPLKHPPMQFYVDQIKGLSAILKDVPLFVYIFTDEPNPREIKQRFQELINKKNITFACREQKNNHNLNVLEDLFSMSEFDCLIRPSSSFSQVAELIGDHKIVISSHHSIWYQDKLIIDEVLITVCDENVIS